MASKTAVNSFYGTGRRKTSSARVYLRQGTGKVSINGRTLDEFFGRETGRMIVQQLSAAAQLDAEELIESPAIDRNLARALTQVNPRARRLAAAGAVKGIDGCL